jgi:N-acetylmuramoyl-L-alanine amidase
MSAMLPSILAYLTRVTLVSAFLYGYYWFFLRNAAFHQYNRYYLLGAVIASLAFPLLRVSIGALAEMGSPASAMEAIHQITSGNWEESPVTASPKGLVPAFPVWIELASPAYFLIIGLFLILLFRRIRYILRISRKYPQQRMGDIRIFLTTEPGTPFSFLKRIFWNIRLDIEGPQGKQVFRHELFHSRQKHSLDILFLELCRAIFWCNPFFHLIRREIKITHEFMADRYAVSSGDEYPGNKYEYAELLVWQAVGAHNLPLVHSFFNTHLKRRIAMLTRLTNTRPGYFSRIMILPLAFLLFCAFATKWEQHEISIKPIIVIIDAGHGGPDAGAISATGVKEKDITLAIAKKVQQLAGTYKINVLMTRESDQIPGDKTNIHDGLWSRAAFANAHSADLFISIHMNAGSTVPSKGMQVWLSPQNHYFQKSTRLGAVMLEEMKKTYPTDDALKKRDQGLLVLNESDMPAILLMCGNLDDGKDLDFISDDHNQEMVARSILQGILHYEDASASTTQATPASAQWNNPLLGSYAHQLRYPRQALDNGCESTIWVGLKIAGDGAFTFSSYDHQPDNDAKKWIPLTITARAPVADSVHGKEPASPLVYGLQALRDEVNKVSEDISGAKTKISIAPGEYFLKFIFRIEKKSTGA